MNKWQLWLAAAVPIARDLVGLAGLGLIVGGIALWSTTAAMVAGGAVLVYAAMIWGARG